jgi:hypothetical protein
MLKRTIIILIHAFIGWALCGAIMMVGRKIISTENTLIIHAIAVPIIFAIISFIYFNLFRYTTPLQTAFIFFCFIMFMDIFVVALLIEKSFEMFKSILGLWIPVALIFISTYLTGFLIKRMS